MEQPAWLVLVWRCGGRQERGSESELRHEMGLGSRRKSIYLVMKMTGRGRAVRVRQQVAGPDQSLVST